MQTIAVIAIVVFTLTIWALAIRYTVRNESKKALIVFTIAVIVSIFGVFTSRVLDSSATSVSTEEKVHDGR